MYFLYFLQAHFTCDRYSIKPTGIFRFPLHSPGIHDPVWGYQWSRPMSPAFSYRSHSPSVNLHFHTQRIRPDRSLPGPVYFPPRRERHHRILCIRQEQNWADEASSIHVSSFNHLLLCNRIIQQPSSIVWGMVQPALSKPPADSKPVIPCWYCSYRSRRYMADFPFHGKITQKSPSLLSDEDICPHYSLIGIIASMCSTDADFRSRTALHGSVQTLRLWQHQVCFLIHIPGYPDQLHFQVHPSSSSFLFTCSRDSLIRPLITGRHIYLTFWISPLSASVAVVSLSHPAAYSQHLFSLHLLHEFSQQPPNSPAVIATVSMSICPLPAFSIS